MTRREAIRRTSFILGYSISAASIAGVMSGCQAETTGLDWQPVFFTKEEGATIAEMAERMLPKTDTPGAKDVGAHEYIDAMLKQVYTPEAQEVVKQGLTQLEETCQKAHGKSFALCTAEQQDAELKDLQAAAIKAKAARKEGEERTFFEMIRELTFLGYFRSEKIGTEVLTYDPIPGPYQGCIPVSDVGNAWSLT